MKPNILFIVDIRNWAYDYRAKTWQKMLEDSYSIDILYLEDYSETKNIFIFDHAKYDGIVIFYHRALKSSALSGTPLPLDKVAVCINNCKWKVDGSTYTYNTYFKDIKVLACCNDVILKEFSRFHNNTCKVSQLVDNKIFYNTRKNLVSDRIKRNFIVGWSGNKTNIYKNVDFITRACEEARVQLSVSDNLNQEILNKWYNALDCVVCASIDEGGPNMLLESGACAIPIITTPIGLVPEIIQHEKNGLIVKPNRMDIMIKTIKELSRNIPLRETLAANIQPEILNNWTYDAKLYEIKNMLERLVS